MADEQGTQTGTPQEPATVTQPVTDAALSSAFDAAQTDSQTQTQVTDQTTTQQEDTTGQQQTDPNATTTDDPEEPADNAERSRLGRRMKTLEDTLSEIKGLLKSGPQTAQPQAQQPAATQPEANMTFDDSYIQRQIDAAVEQGIIPATIMSPTDQWKVNQFVGNVQAHMNRQYATNYVNTLQSAELKGATPDDVHNEVVAELNRLESPFNLRRYDNPLVDARMNYLEAKAAILEKKMATTTPGNVFKGQKPGGPATGTNVTTRTATVAETPIQLDEAAQDFIKRTGMSDESVKTALKSDMPLHLRGGLR